MPKSLMLVFSKATSAEVEEEFNHWYSTKHVKDVAALDGVISATRYKLEKSVSLMPGVEGDPRDYLAIYEIEADTPEKLLKLADEFKAALEEGRADVSVTLDVTDASTSFAFPITEKIVVPN